MTVPRRKVKAAHHKGSYHVQSRHVRTLAYANPSTLCWRCGKTLPEHGPRARWTAGHVIDGQIGGELRPEASTCNYAAGAQLINTPTKSALWR